MKSKKKANGDNSRTESLNTITVRSIY